MKMVSAAKYNRAERELKPARSYGGGAQGKVTMSSSGYQGRIQTQLMTGFH